jgi:hypothetical protein
MLSMLLVSFSRSCDFLIELFRELNPCSVQHIFAEPPSLGMHPISKARRNVLFSIHLLLLVFKNRITSYQSCRGLGVQQPCSYLIMFSELVKLDTLLCPPLLHGVLAMNSYHFSLPKANTFIV